MVTTLIGDGAHGRDIQVIASRCGRDVAVTDEARSSFHVKTPCLIGINNPITRREVAERWPIAAEPLVDPSVIRGRQTVIRGGCVVAPNVVLLREVVLGCHVHVNYGSSMTRCTIGDFTTIAPGVTICGDVEIGEAVFVGAGAVICNLVKIGNEAIIGAGAVVTDDVQPGETVVTPQRKAIHA
jgi:acetyltransferase-like isoleucine patch superfamily enzyme